MRTCFVIQGFGKKTDFTDGRVLDLDASYAVIKEAVAACGLQCIRADEIKHSGTIDLPMYEQLLGADLVIADLSTYNLNAAFELGVRYGLRPHATIVVAEEGFKPAFDVTHIVIRRYKHLGEDIGRREAERFQQELKEAITAILEGATTDSPVYTFLSELEPPRRRAVQQAVAQVEAAAERAAADLKTAQRRGGGESLADADTASPRELLSKAQECLRNSDFAEAKAVLTELHRRQPNERHVVHQLALATYKGKQPDARTALLEAKARLSTLSPETSNDPETLGLWGAVHKRLWDQDGDPGALDTSIESYLRGFELKQDYYNGVNYATLLEVRALRNAQQGEHEEAIADRVAARRVRQQVLRYLAPTLEDPKALQELDSAPAYWLLASAWEAYAGLGQADAAARLEAQARAVKPDGWMLQATQEQIERIRLTQEKLRAALEVPGQAIKSRPAGD